MLWFLIRTGVMKKILHYTIIGSVITSKLPQLKRALSNYMHFIKLIHMLVLQFIPKVVSIDWNLLFVFTSKFVYELFS